MSTISPCLWFDRDCEDAVTFYLSVFPDSKLLSLTRYPAELQAGPAQEFAGKVQRAVFDLAGYRFYAFDGGPLVRINPSLSFFVNFDPSRNANAAADLDALWAKLIDGGFALMPLQAYPFSKRFGWVQDRFGVSWQLILTNPAGAPRPDIIPSQLFTGAVCGRAEEALRFYVSVFGDGELGNIARYGKGMEPNAEGTAMFAEARLFDHWFTAMDSAAGHGFAFTEATSFIVQCDGQADMERYRRALTADGGRERNHGWLTDKFGFSWQMARTSQPG